MPIRVSDCLAGLLILSLAGCDNASPSEEALESLQGPNGSVVEAASEEARDCLRLIWEAREKADDFRGDAEKAFDRDHDAAVGGAISCATLTSASQFEATLEALRVSATNADRAGLLAEAGIPLIFIDKDGEIERLENAEALEAAFDNIFPEATLERLRGLALSNMTVVPDRGAFFDLGAIWLVVPEVGARPQLVTINDQAAGEAAEIAAQMDEVAETAE